MASNYRPIAASDFVKTMVKNLPIEDVGPAILDRVSKIIWMAAPWRWTLASFPEITLASNTQDYTVALPNDFLYVVTASITDSTTGESGRPISVSPVLPTNVGAIGFPNEIAVTGTAGGSGTARVRPKPGTISGATLKIYSLYKKVAPTITNRNQATAGVLVMDDEWFWVYESGVLWLAYAYADDQRAGAATMTSTGQWQFSGQRGVFEANLAVMKQREKMPDVSIFPATQTADK